MSTRDTDSNTHTTSDAVQDTDPDFVRLQSKLTRWLDRIEKLGLTGGSAYLKYRNCRDTGELSRVLAAKRSWFLENMFSYDLDFTTLVQNSDHYCNTKNVVLLQFIGNNLQLAKSYTYHANNITGIHNIDRETTGQSVDAIDEIKVLDPTCKCIRLYIKEVLVAPGFRSEIYWPVYDVSCATMIFPKPLPLLEAQSWAFKVIAGGYAQIRISNDTLDIELRKRLFNHFALAKLDEFVTRS